MPTELPSVRRTLNGLTEENNPAFPKSWVTNGVEFDSIEPMETIQTSLA
jgi:hypothetical protein